MKKHMTTILLCVIFLAGLSLLLYPTVADYWNSMHQTRLITEYASTVAMLDDDTYERIWDSAVAYNEQLTALGSKPHELDDEEKAAYEQELDVYGNGMMGYIEIPSIDCTLPIYHGTSDQTLQVAIGHLEGSSLPVGGESTHCVLSGHRGLPSAKLFSNLDQLTEGDTFMLHILDETLTYEVDQILIVEPDELDALAIIEGEDLCTLLTCTPYGVNTHRLLVRGHRVPNSSELRVTADALQIEPKLVAPFVAIPILLLMLIWMLVTTRKHKKKKKREKSEENTETKGRKRR